MLSKNIKIFGLLIMLPLSTLAGTLEPPSDPETHAMYTLKDICNRLESGTEGSQTTFTEPTAAPASTGCTLNDVMEKAPAKDNTDGAKPSEVLSDKQYWGLTDGNWGVQTGTMPHQGAITYTPTATDQTIAEGYHDGSGIVKGDSALKSENIKQDITIFGVSGSPNVADTSSGDATAADIAKDKKAWVDGEEVTGASYPAPVAQTGQSGSPGVALPTPRFKDNGDGTITDNLTGLMWLKDASCQGERGWNDANTDITDLNNGSSSCQDYTATYNNWRLPTVKELQSLIHYGFEGPALSNKQGNSQWSEGDVFSKVRSDPSISYWSATEMSSGNSLWIINLFVGHVGSGRKTGIMAVPHYVWPVREMN